MNTILRLAKPAFFRYNYCKRLLATNAFYRFSTCYGTENTTLESNFVCLMRLFVMTFSLYDKVSYWPTLLLTSTITEEGLREPGGKPWIRIRKRMVKLQLDESASTSLNREKKNNNSVGWPIRVSNKLSFWAHDRAFTNCCIFRGALGRNTSLWASIPAYIIGCSRS